jgi:outer membrane immunogenic protein
MSLLMWLLLPQSVRAQQDSPRVPEARSAPIVRPANASSVVTFTPTRTAVQAPVFSWEGFYVGFDAGYHFGSADTTFDPLPTPDQFISLEPTTLPMSPRGFSYRAVGGMNRAMGIWIVGVEGDITFGTPDAFELMHPIIQNNGSNFDGTLYAGEYVNRLVTARARVGREYNGCFIFATGGVAFGSVDYYGEADFNPGGNVTSRNDFTKNRIGWTIGAGLEHPISEHLAIKGEFRLLDLGSQTAVADPTPAHPPFQVENSWQTKGWNLNAGVSYHFGKR